MLLRTLLLSPKASAGSRNPPTAQPKQNRQYATNFKTFCGRRVRPGCPQLAYAILAEGRILITKLRSSCMREDWGRYLGSTRVSDASTFFLLSAFAEGLELTPARFACEGPLQDSAGELRSADHWKFQPIDDFSRRETKYPRARLWCERMAHQSREGD